jgi:hypothetical protein
MAKEKLIPVEKERKMTFEDVMFALFLILLGIFLVFCLAMGIASIVWEIQTQEISGTIVSTQIEGGETHFVFQHDTGIREVLENEDSLIKGKFNSSDFMVNLEVGKSYTMTVNRKRIPFFSLYRNILEYEIQ